MFRTTYKKYGNNLFEYKHEEKILKLEVKKTNYVYVHLCKNGQTRHFRVHRLVAETFIDNPENKSQVNHIDGNKLNNRADNLEWCTQSENQKHCTEIGLRIMPSGKNCTSSKAVLQYDLKGNFIKEWDCIKQIEKELKIHASNISRVCKGVYSQSHNYIWKFKGTQ